MLPGYKQKKCGKCGKVWEVYDPPKRWICNPCKVGPSYWKRP